MKNAEAKAEHHEEKEKPAARKKITITSPKADAPVTSPIGVSGTCDPSETRDVIVTAEFNGSTVGSVKTTPVEGKWSAQLEPTKTGPLCTIRAVIDQCDDEAATVSGVTVG